MSYDLPADDQPETVKKKHILIVEDNSLNMKLFHDILVAKGYDVTGTSRGREAFDLVELCSPDLILMDIQLSEMSGYDVIAQIKQDETKAKIPIIAVTAYAMREDELKVRKMGCFSYISKPIFIKPFTEEIARALNNVPSITAEAA